MGLAFSSRNLCPITSVVQEEQWERVHCFWLMPNWLIPLIYPRHNDRGLLDNKCPWGGCLGLRRADYNIWVNDLALCSLRRGTRLWEAAVYPWNRLPGTSLPLPALGHVHKWFSGSETYLHELLKVIQRDSRKICRLEVKVPVHSTRVQSMKILCCFFSRQFLFHIFLVSTLPVWLVYFNPGRKDWSK